ncbi:hypothetical protein [Arthrobacter gengyunqii]|uniref:Flp pilus-assembly TadG-like N-terminal domain-containing protein n=1 Tax=Arthrobacter gengyunqii TaxID=2886940 RepID=A0ABS8GKZ2_9MICC|nr:hypothetical protein [Arthrobacter gengyunqii]MCC3265908.1 hypothetical protein [Arthrobacter gengyunqii]
MGDEAVPKQDGEKSRLERFKVVAEIGAFVILLVTAALTGRSLYLAGQANATAEEANNAARDATAAVREGNDVAAATGTFDGLSFQQEERSQVPRVLINDGGNKDTEGEGRDGHSQGTGWNPSQYPAIVLGAVLEFNYTNVEGDNENSNAALERATVESCVMQVWSASDDGTAASASFPCDQPVSVGPGDVLWVSAGIPEDQKRMFCARHPEGVAGFSIEVKHALHNVSNDLNDTPPPGSMNLVCKGRSFADL